MLLNKNKKGFTLIELLVVISIIGLLATLAIVSLQTAKVNSRDTRRKEDLKQIYTALSLYLSTDSTGLYPCGDPTETAPNCSNTSFFCFGSSGLTDLVTEEVMAGLPSDPLPERTAVSTGCYNYRSDGRDFKIRATMENDDNIMQNDGSTSSANNSWYEIFTTNAINW